MAIQGAKVDAIFSPANLEIMGLIGVALYLGSYVLLQLGVISGSGNVYTLMNLAAACFVLASLMQAFNLSSAIIQIAWIVISVVGLGRRAILNAMVRFSDDDTQFLTTVFPEMPKPMARRFLDRGNWVVLSPGTVITEEGTPVANLHYLMDGQAKVVSGGQEVATLNGGLIGEMNVRDGGPASATVTIAAPSRAFVISRNALNTLAKADADFRVLLENGMSTDIRRKLAAANARMAQSGATAL